MSSTCGMFSQAWLSSSAAPCCPDRIPGAIAASWAEREVDFDFQAIQDPAENLPGLYTVVPRHALPSPPPVERPVSLSSERNIRMVQPFARGRASSLALPAVAGARAHRHVGLEPDRAHPAGARVTSYKCCMCYNLQLTTYDLRLATCDLPV